jgi:hypothetical protein
MKRTMIVIKEMTPRGIPKTTAKPIAVSKASSAVSPVPVCVAAEEEEEGLITFVMGSVGKWEFSAG